MCCFVTFFGGAGRVARMVVYFIRFHSAFLPAPTATSPAIVPRPALRGPGAERRDATRGRGGHARFVSSPASPDQCIIRRKCYSVSKVSVTSLASPAPSLIPPRSSSTSNHSCQRDSPSPTMFHATSIKYISACYAVCKQKHSPTLIVQKYPPSNIGHLPC